MSPKKMHLVGGFSPTPLKNRGVKVSWGYCIVPNIWKNQNHAPNHQPECELPYVVFASSTLMSKHV
jgi:hypothetical protein